MAQAGFTNTKGSFGPNTSMNLIKNMGGVYFLTHSLGSDSIGNGW